MTHTAKNNGRLLSVTYIAIISYCILPLNWSYYRVLAYRFLNWYCEQSEINWSF